MPKRVPVQAIDHHGHIVHTFPSIAAAAGAGFCAASISMSLNHGKVIEGVRWRRVNKAPPLSIDRLEAVASRLEAVADRLMQTAAVT